MGFEGCLGAVADTELAEDVGEVVFNGAFSDVELGGDFFVAGSGGDEVEDFQLAVGEGFGEFGWLGGVGGLGFREAAEFSNDFGGDGGLEEGFAACGGADGFDEFLGGDIFKEVANGSGAEAIEDVVVVVKGGEDDDLAGGVSLFDAAGGGNAVKDRHTEIHEDDIGVVVENGRYCLLPIPRLCHHLQIIPNGEERSQTLAEEGLIVYQ